MSSQPAGTDPATKKHDDMDEPENVVTIAEHDGQHEVADAVRAIEIPSNKWLRRYRSVIFQMVMLGILSFSGPSMSDAISGLGGGGQATPHTANQASAVQYALSSVFAMFGGPIIGAIGIVGGCIVGALGFPLSGTGFYVLSKYNVQWYLIFAKALYGITAAFLYVAESSAMISYPEENRRGLYLSLWVGARNLGSVISGAISLGLNVATSGAGAVSTNTYLVFIALECLGVPAALLLTRSSKVIRNDGYGVPLLPKKSWKKEMQLLWEHHKQRRTLLLIPVYIFTFFGDGVWFTYLAVHFSVRTRALSSLIAPVSSIVLQPIFGYILDQRRWGPRAKGMAAYGVYMGASLVMAVWGFAMIAWFKRQDPDLRLDFHNDSARWFAAYAPFWMYFVFSYMGQIYVYWILGQFASDVTSNARTGGVYRSWETVGQAVSYGMDSHVKNEYIPIGVLLALTVACAPGLWTVVKDLPEQSKEIVVADENGMTMDAVDDKVTRA
ncbi:hypothetical protein I317_00854 [Kwoniella heveanensis CBS 569]|nr:hypothetical protein I317_00854 [Kwoniella heveanensis CBS 569]